MGACLLYEWRRITSIRSTYVLAFLFFASTGLVAFLVYQVSGAGIPAEEGGLAGGDVPLGVIVQAGTNFLSAIFVTTVAAQSFGHEYRYGMVRLTLSEFPRRPQVYAAKLLMVLVWVAALYLVSIAVAVAVVRLAGGQVGLGGPELGEQLLRAGLYLLGYCTIAFALTALTRNLILGVVIPLLLGAVVEPLASAGLSDRLPWLPGYLPISAGQRFLSGDQANAVMGADATAAIPSGGLVFLAWVVVLAVVALVLFDRRDA